MCVWQCVSIDRMRHESACIDATEVSLEVFFGTMVCVQN